MLLPRRMRWEILHFAAFFASCQLFLSYILHLAFFASPQFCVIHCKCICYSAFFASPQFRQIRISYCNFICYSAFFTSPQFPWHMDQSLPVYLLLLQIQPPRIALSVRPCHSDIISLPLINRSVSGESGKPKAWVGLGWGDYGPSYLIIVSHASHGVSVKIFK